MKNNFTIGSLFDGSGGFPLVAHLCGGTPIWASEVEPYPIAVTKSRFPHMKHLGDISKINGGKIEPVDVITFGSPCQDLSVAGKRAGLKHEENGDTETTRSGLFMEAIRIIKEMRDATNGLYPTFAVWENVPGAFSSNKGEDFRIVLEEFIKIIETEATMPSPPKSGWPYADSYVGDGWSLAYRTFDAQYWGVPQRRRRIYLVADFAGGRAARILFERESLRGHFTQGKKPWKRATADAERSVGTDGFTKVVYAVENHPADSRVNIIESGKCQTLTSRMGTGGGNVPMVMESYGFPLGFRPENTKVYEETATTLCNGTRAGFTTGVVISNTYQKVTGPLMANSHPGSYTGQDAYSDMLVTPKVESRYIVRRLTPIECARLQGFPDRWGEIDCKEDLTDEEYQFWLDVRNTHANINGKQVKEYTKQQMLNWYNKLHSNSSEYKMWGNGIALPNALYVMWGISENFNESGVNIEKP